MPYSPDTGYLYVPGTIRTSVFSRVPSEYCKHGQRYVGGTQAAPIGSPMSGTFTAIDGTTNKIAWQHKLPYRMGGGGGSTVTAGGLLLARLARRQLRRARRQDRRGAVEVPDRLRRRCAADGLRGRRRAVHRHRHRRQFDPGQCLRRRGLGILAEGAARSAVAAAAAAYVAGPAGAIADGVDKVNIGDNNVEYPIVRPALG